MNKKAFTLVELLAMLTILGILLIITIPNINGILENNKKKTYIEDGKRLISIFKYKYSEPKSSLTGDNICITLSKLDYNDSFKKGPNGGEYIDSYIQFKKTSSSSTTYKYEYIVVLNEKIDDETFLSFEASEDDLEKGDITINKLSKTKAVPSGCIGS